jgi:hypothetical protein
LVGENDGKQEGTRRRLPELRALPYVWAQQPAEHRHHPAHLEPALLRAVLVHVGRFDERQHQLFVGVGDRNGRELMAKYRKFIVAALTAATTAVSLGLLADPWDKYVAVASATLGALGVFAVTNEQPA